MMIEDYRQYIILCLGGSQPGVSLLDPVSTHVSRLLSLPAGHSLYAADISDDGNTLGVGSKTGFAYLVSSDVPNDSANGDARRYYQGVPILSVCFTQQDELAAADADGNLLLWDLIAGLPIRRLCRETTEPLCLLFRPGEDLLAGLSISGQLVFWHSNCDEPSRIIPASPPPPLYGLVKAVFWEAANRWVWPDRTGRLTLFDPHSLGISYTVAHPGGFYASCVHRKRLITVGESDGRMVFWSPDGHQPSITFEVPVGIISLAVWQKDVPQYLLIGANGKAAIYVSGDDGLEPSQRLPGNDYRIAIIPQPELSQKQWERWKSERAEELCREIQTRIESGKCDDLPELHHELMELGYRHMSLWLQAATAAKSGSIIEQLQALHELAALIEQEDLDLPECLNSYARLLTHIWQLQAAQSVYAKLQASDVQDAAVSAKLADVTDLLEIIAQQDVIIETATPLVAILQAGELVGHRFEADYVLKQGVTFSVAGRMDPDDFVGRYDASTRKEQRESLAGIVTELHWMMDECHQSATAIRFDIPSSELSLVLRYDFQHGQTMLTPAVTVSCGAFYNHRPKCSAEDFVCQVESQLESDPRLKMINITIARVSRQFVTRSKSLQNIY